MSDVATIDEPVQLVEVTRPAAVLVDVIGQGTVVISGVPQPPIVQAIGGAGGLINVITPGPPGPIGDTGSTGATGATGPSPTYEQDFNVAQMVWVINHPLHARPVVTTVDLNGDEVTGDVAYPDLSTVIVTFGVPFAGKALLKA